MPDLWGRADGGESERKKLGWRDPSCYDIHDTCQLHSNLSTWTSNYGCIVIHTVHK